MAMERSDNGQFLPNHARLGGRQAGLAARIRELTRNGEDVALFMHEVFLGQHKATLRERIEAATWLADRGFGKVRHEQETATMQVEIVYVDRLNGHAALPMPETFCSD